MNRNIYNLQKHKYFKFFAYRPGFFFEILKVKNITKQGVQMQEIIQIRKK